MSTLTTIATFSVPAEILKAVSLFSAKKDIRNCLNGVAFYKVGTVLTIAATNGHVLGIFQNMNCTNMPEDFSLLLSLDNVKALSGSTKKGKSVFLCVDKDADGKLFVKDGVTGLTVKAQDDAPLKLESLRRVNATHKAGEGVNTVSIAPEYLELIGKVSGIFGGKYGGTYLVLNKEEAAMRVALGELPEGWQFNGTIMPQRNCTPKLYNPVF